MTLLSSNLATGIRGAEDTGILTKSGTVERVGRMMVICVAEGDISHYFFGGNTKRKNLYK